ncbi:MAG: hypothetical protein ACK5YK_00990 [Pseudomonadota bacterium]|jgi:hypothetical protein
MPKPVAANPKHTQIRKVLAKARPSLVRGVGAAARAQGNPAAAEAEWLKLEAELTQTLKGTLAGSSLPVVSEAEALPENGWVYLALTGRRNAKHGNAACGPAIAVMHEGRMAACGVLLAQEEDLVLAGAGEGISGSQGRGRVTGRELADAMIMLPMSSIDTAKLGLMEKADAVPFHTRKSGNMLADAMMVAIGRADGMIATRFNALEQHCAELMIKEAGGTARVLQTPAGAVFVGGNVKVARDLAALFV